MLIRSEISMKDRKIAWEAQKFFIGDIIYTRQVDHLKHKSRYSIARVTGIDEGWLSTYVGCGNYEEAPYLIPDAVLDLEGIVGKADSALGRSYCTRLPFQFLWKKICEKL